MLTRETRNGLPSTHGVVIRMTDLFSNLRWLTYMTHFFLMLSSRLWDTGIMFIFADLSNNSIAYTATSGLLSSLSVSLFMPIIGNWLDRTNRLKSFQQTITLLLSSGSFSYFICAYLNLFRIQFELNKTFDTFDHFLSNGGLLFMILPILAAVSNLAISTLIQSMEKDWIVVISNHNSACLSEMNAFMCQIDLICSTLVPLFVGYLFTYYSVGRIALVLFLLNASFLISMYYLIKHLYKLLSNSISKNSETSLVLITENESKSSQIATSHLKEDELESYRDEYFPGVSDPDNLSLEDKKRAVNRLLPCCKLFGLNAVFVNIWLGLEDFLNSGCSGTMVAYALLYMTVLSFGSVMMVYLRWAGVSDFIIGLSSGLASFAGFMGAYLFPLVSQSIGLWQTGQLSILFQSFLIVAAAIFFFFPPSTLVLWVIIISILISRVGLWSFDLCARQIAQETIPSHVRGKVNGQWRSLVAFFETSSYILTLVYTDPEQFRILSTISAAFVLLALFTYTATNPTNKIAIFPRKMIPKVI